MQCFHDPLQQLESSHIWSDDPDLVISSIYEQGCLQILRAPVQTSLSIYIVLVVFIVLLHVRILFNFASNKIRILDSDNGADEIFVYRMS